VGLSPSIRNCSASAVRGAAEQRNHFLRARLGSVSGGGEQIERGEQVGVDFAMLFQELVAPGEAGAAVAAGQQAEELQRDFFEADQNAVQFLRAELAARDRPRYRGAVPAPVMCSREAEVLAGDVFDLVRFVEDHRVVVGQDRHVSSRRTRQVGEEQVVVDDDDVGFGARWCISVMKQRSNCLHFWPAQSSERASILAQAVLSSGSVRISARSPVSVVFPSPG
jgi:hypothetical protein